MIEKNDSVIIASGTIGSESCCFWDSSKFGRKGFGKTCNFEDIDEIKDPSIVLST